MGSMNEGLAQDKADLNTYILQVGPLQKHCALEMNASYYVCCSLKDEMRLFDIYREKKMTNNRGKEKFQ